MTGLPTTKKVAAVFAGTFDPITLGHQEMIERALRSWVFPNR